ncbi:MAG: helix-hairpin-helix domain-containing protein [Deltaproteobacteria bacterium]|nr:helix-hairpin-helix domain-containing protein [Deltaproteobacteria bacterium]
MSRVQRLAAAIVSALLIWLPVVLSLVDGGALPERCAGPRLAETPSCSGASRATPCPTTVRCDAIGPPLRGGAAVLLGLPLDVNRATARELAEVPGVSPALASAIVAERSSRGSFSSLDELQHVAGLGPRRLARLARYLSAGDPPPLHEPPR